MKLKYICSNIACNYLKVGDIVECVQEGSNDTWERSIGERIVVDNVRKAVSSQWKYIVSNGTGHFANCFKKVEQ